MEDKTDEELENEIKVMQEVIFRTQLPNLMTACADVVIEVDDNKYKITKSCLADFGKEGHLTSENIHQLMNRLRETHKDAVVIVHLI